MIPNLDRFSRQLAKERGRVKELLLLPTCDVCGQDVDRPFIEEWNGVTACKYCIRDINEEAEQYAIFNYDHG